MRCIKPLTKDTYIEQKDLLIKNSLEKAGYDVETIVKIKENCKNVKVKLDFKILHFHQTGVETVHIEGKYYGRIYIEKGFVVREEV